MKKSKITKPLKVCALALALTAGFASPALASPLALGGWTQVGLMNADGNMFNGNCNLRLSGCTFGTPGAADYWQSYTGATEMLFITGDGQFWGQADYAVVTGLLNSALGTFTPNLTWIDAGRNGVSIGAATGNLLMRNGVGEDPWVTLVGDHCAHFSNTQSCSEVIWGESAFSWSGRPHVDLMMAHQGVAVYARNTAVNGVPEPGSFALAGLALAGLALTGKRRRA